MAEANIDIEEVTKGFFRVPQNFLHVAGDDWCMNSETFPNRCLTGFNFKNLNAQS